MNRGPFSRIALPLSVGVTLLACGAGYALTTCLDNINANPPCMYEATITRVCCVSEGGGIYTERTCTTDRWSKPGVVYWIGRRFCGSAGDDCNPITKNCP
jgi:hypothetical protein